MGLLIMENHSVIFEMIFNYCCSSAVFCLDQSTAAVLTFLWIFICCDMKSAIWAVVSNLLWWWAEDVSHLNHHKHQNIYSKEICSKEEFWDLKNYCANESYSKKCSLLDYEGKEAVFYDIGSSPSFVKAVFTGPDEWMSLLGIECNQSKFWRNTLLHSYICYFCVFGSNFNLKRGPKMHLLTF